MAFLFQTADIIINPSVLLRGTQDQRRQDILDAFPYFLGVVDEDSAAREAKRTHGHQVRGPSNGWLRQGT